MYIIIIYLFVYNQRTRKKYDILINTYETKRHYNNYYYDYFADIINFIFMTSDIEYNIIIYRNRYSK